MPDSRPPAVLLAQSIRLIILYSAPGVLSLLVLALLGYVQPFIAFGAGVVAVATTVPVVRWMVSEWGGLAAQIRLISDRDDAPQLTAGYSFQAADDIAVAVTSMRRQIASRAEAAAAASKYLTSVLESLPEPLLVVSASRKVTSANASARQAFGREVLARELTGVLRDPELLQAVDDALLKRNHHKDLTLRFPGAVERTFQVIVEPLPEGVADTPHALITLHDVTDLVRLEQMRADFVANASHELRTPLTSVLGFIDTLRGPAHDDEEARDRFLAIMSQQAERMRNLIEDLLSLSRIELREHTRPTDHVPLHELVEGVVDGLIPQAAEKSVKLVIHVSRDVPPVLGDPDELTQVIQNLLSNAIKYGRPGTIVTVRAEASERRPVAMPRIIPGSGSSEQCIALSVTDQGDGIAKEHLPRLTERFYRVDNARSRQMGGTGLGLAIVKHIVNRHRGALTIDSTVGEGSTFTVWLPQA